MSPPVITGNTGQAWRADITPGGGLRPWHDGTPPLDWFIAADDRWHQPEHEPGVRQVRLGGTPVTETRVRVPNGDVVQRVYSVADHGGLTVIEVENESTLPVAIAFSRRGVLTERPIADIPIEGIEIAGNPFVLPLGHAASLRVGVPHGPAADGRFPTVPSAEQVVRGWHTLCGMAGRAELPDGELGRSLAERVDARRCDILLGDVPNGADAPVEFLVAFDQLARMGEPVHPWVEEVADAVEAIAAQPGWKVGVALIAAERVLRRAGENRAVADIGRLRAGRVDEPLPEQVPVGDTAIAWHEQRLAFGGVLMPAGIPESWRGQSFEAFSVPTEELSTVGFGVRWHGEHPALIWEQHGEPVELTAPSVAPNWRSAEERGETLLVSR